MHLIVFLTNSASLVAIGVPFHWERGKDFHQFQIIPYQDLVIGIRERQIWIVSDRIPFSELKQQLNRLPLTEVYYVYHRHPTVDFRELLEAYLSERGIFCCGLRCRQSPNTNSIYLEISRYPFTPDDFHRIVERISPCNDRIGLLMNQLNDVSDVLDNRVKLPDFPEWVRAIYEKQMTGVTPENFEQKCAALQRALEKYCREKGP